MRQLHDSRTIRYPDPLIKEGDSVMVDIASNKITDFVKFDAGALCMVTGGRNAGACRVSLTGAKSTRVVLKSFT